MKLRKVITKEIELKPDNWQLTRERYSVTTTQQINWFARSTRYPVMWVDQI